MLVHKSALAVCAEVSQEDRSRHSALGFTQVHDDVVEATNGHIWVKVTEAGRPAEEYPTVEGLEIAARGPVLISKQSIAQVLKLVAKKTIIPILQCVAIVPKDHQITLAVQGDDGLVQRLDTQRVDHQFPNTAHLNENTPAAKTFMTLGVTALQTLLKSMAAGQIESIRFGISDSTHPVRFWAKGEHISVEGLMAQMADGTPAPVKKGKKRR